VTPRRWQVAAAAGVLACACVPVIADRAGEAEAQVLTPPPAYFPAAVPAGPATFQFDGQMIQGGWIRGQAPAGTTSARLGEQALTIDSEGRFFAAFDRDAGRDAELVAVLAGGRELRSALAIAPRNWRIEHINAARRPGGSTEAFMAIRTPELERIAAARARDTGAGGWRESFIRPASGRYSGFFGSQRIYRGEPASYHSGLDIAGGQGAQVIAPASGVVVLAADAPFTLEGNLLIIDHGQGLNSAFLHLSRIDVREGEAVAQGQPIGRIGATGRVTGPHLHWSLKWHDARLDPLLFLPQTE
jgi:murein DD-endopeptidase MepM/ murein hydrolase activator NlpD